MSSDYPDDLRYTREHEWARPEGNLVTVGITKFAVESLGDMTMVDLPKDQSDAVADYLARNFPEKPKPPAVLLPGTAKATATTGRATW